MAAIAISRRAGVAVSVDGPYPTVDRWGDEIPEWTVCVIDEEGEPAGTIYRVKDRDRAIELAARMSRDRRLPLNNEASYA